MNTTTTHHHKTQNTEPLADSRRLRELKSPVLFTVDLREQSLNWTAVAKSRRAAPVLRGSIEIGYTDLESLSGWMMRFFERLGEIDIDIHLIISGPEMVQRCFRIPKVPRSEIPAVLRSSARKLYPFDLNRSLFGWRISDSVEWAGGLKYEIFSQALSNEWREWLCRIFGDRIDSVSLVTSSGLYLEKIITDLVPGFNESGTLLIRLNGHTAETGIFHEGGLEFYREVTVDTLAEDNTVSDLKRMIGESESMEDNASASKSEVIASLRSLVGDVLDYYYGQFGQRKIKRVICLVPSEYSDSVAEFARQSIATEVINLNTESVIARHSRIAGITSVFSDYPVWISCYPNWKRRDFDINLLPEEVKSRHSLKIKNRLAATSLVIAVLVMAVMSILAATEVESLEQHLTRTKANLERLEADPVLPLLSAFESRVETLRENVKLYVARGVPSIKRPFLALSRNSKETVRLDGVEINRLPSGFQANVSGYSVGPSDAQEAEYYTYLRALETDPNIRAIAPGMKKIETQFGRQKLGFTHEVVTR